MSRSLERMASIPPGSPSHFDIDGSMPAAELGRRLFLRSVSSSVDESASPSLRAFAKKTSSSHDHAEQEEEESESDEEVDEVARRRQARRRSSVVGGKIASQIPSRTVIDSRFVINPTSPVSSFDMMCFRLEKDLYFVHRDELGDFRTVIRIQKLPKTLLGTSTWQMYTGNAEPVGVIKQASRTLGSVFYMFRGSDARKGEIVYSFSKKLRSTKIRIFNGEGCKEAALLSHFCLIGDDRVYVKLKDAKAIGMEALGETIVDWRLQSLTLRIGRGFDVCLAAASFCLADAFEPHALDIPVQMKDGVLHAVHGPNKTAATTDWRKMCGW